MRNWPPVSITTDKLGSYRQAIRRLQPDGHLAEGVAHRTSKYLNTIVEADHGALKQVIRPARNRADESAVAAPWRAIHPVWSERYNVAP